MGCHFLLSNAVGNFLTQGLKLRLLRLLHCQEGSFPLATRETRATSSRLSLLFLLHAAEHLAEQLAHSEHPEMQPSVIILGGQPCPPVLPFTIVRARMLSNTQNTTHVCLCRNKYTSVLRSSSNTYNRPLWILPSYFRAATKVTKQLLEG